MKPSSLAVVLAAVAGALLPSFARADVVKLKDGRTLEGRVSRDGARVIVESRHGQVVVAQDEVASIERLPSLDEQFEVEQRVTVMDDPADVERLAAWCRERGMLGRSRQLLERARGLREAEARRVAEEQLRARDAALAARREGVRDDDGEGLYRLALWAEGEGHPAAVVDRLLREALLADPLHARARVAEELRRAQAAAADALARAERSRAQAAAELDGAKAARRDAEAKQAAVTALQARLEEAERTLDQRRGEVARREALASEAQRRAEGWERQARHDAERVAAELRALQDERCRLEAERRALEAERCRLQQQGGHSHGPAAVCACARPVIVARGTSCRSCGLPLRR